MASQTRTVGTGASMAVGGSAGGWSNTSNILLEDGTYAKSAAFTSAVVVNDRTMRLVNGSGSIVGDNKADGQWPFSTDPTEDETKVFGGATDDWNASLTVTDINDTDFGCMIACQGDVGGYSDNLRASNFGFTIPTGATIDGIIVTVVRSHIIGLVAQVDYVEITVHYTLKPNLHFLGVV